MKKFIQAAVLLLFLFAGSESHAQKRSDHYDVVIYGGTSAAVMAAVAAKQAGASVILLSPQKHIGGVTSSGLGWTDIGREKTIGGLTLDFFHRVYQYYQRPAAWKQETLSAYGKKVHNTIHGIADSLMWTFEPHVAEKIFNDLIRENNIPVKLDQWLNRVHGVKKENGRISAITMLNGLTYRGKVFIDATYEGDLMAASGVSYTLGREPNARYGETINGIETAKAKGNNLPRGIDPYVQKGNPASGLLPGINANPGGKDGEGDKKIQAYCYRVCLTNVPEDRVMVKKPAGYREKDFELIIRAAERGETRFWKLDPVPNGKTDSNNASGISTDDIGGSDAYPEASYEERRKIEKAHQYWTEGLIWTVQHDPRVPAAVRDKYAAWGLPKDEFADNGHLPYKIYVREARRMVSDFVMTEAEVKGEKPVAESIAMGYYNMDSHNVQRYVTDKGDVQNEGDVQISPGKPYPIPYGTIIPKASESTNLLVPVCLSASHAAYGSIRMEPVFMILGQSAGIAAAIATAGNMRVQDIPYGELKKELLKNGQVLTLPSFVPLPAANKELQEGERYKHEMQQLHAAIQKKFYDVASGYYKDIADPRDKKPYSYLWPLCGLLQADNEMEKVAGNKNLFDKTFSIIRDYYSVTPPAPGYDSYIVKFKGGDRFYDDNQWIGIALMDAYFRTGKPLYLDKAGEIYRFMMTGHDTASGGGLYWKEGDHSTKNTCSNGPGILLSLQLYQATKDSAFLKTALSLYQWVNRVLRAPSGLYYDNIRLRDHGISKATYSYNTGTMLEANVYLYELTRQKDYLTEAIAIADSSTVFFYGNNGFRDGYWFNAVMLRAYQRLFKEVRDPKYLLAFKRCLDYSLADNKNGEGLMGEQRPVNLVNQAGMLEILARFAYMGEKENIF